MTTNFIDADPWGPLLRALRSQRPPLAAKGARAKTFGSGLEQAEQLWLASLRVGAVASPLLLFYGLTQAGRAMCAAGIPGPRWEGAHQHGLSLDLDAPGQDELFDLASARIRPNGKGLVQQVGEVLGSPVLESGALFSDLISAVSDQLYFADNRFTLPRPLEVSEEVFWPSDPWGAPARMVLHLAPAPESLASEREHVPAGPSNVALNRVVPPSPEAIADWLSPYPSLHKLGVPSKIHRPERFQDERSRSEWGIRVEWGDGARVVGLNQTEWTLSNADVVLDNERNGGRGIALPAVGGNSTAQDPLVTWWLILYALSMLARYYPRV